MSLRIIVMCCLLLSMFGLAATDRHDTQGSDTEAASVEPTAPRMQSSHVAMLSNAFAAKRIGAFDYRVTRVAYELEPGSRLWSIHYELGAAPDGSQPDPTQFDVLVDDRNGRIRFADAKDRAEQASSMH